MGRLNEALAIEVATLGREHPGTATSLNNIGTVLHTRGRLEEAPSAPAPALPSAPGSPLSAAAQAASTAAVQARRSLLALVASALTAP